MCDSGQHTEVEDQHSGDIVCTSCGRVTGQVLMAAAMSDSQPPLGAWKHAECLQLREIVMDICAALHMESNHCLVDTVVSIYLDLVRRCRYCANSRGVEKVLAPPTNDHCRAKLAVAMTEALNRQRSPRNPEQIAELCHVRPSLMLQIEKLTGCGSFQCAPRDLMPFMAKVLELPWRASIIAQEFCTMVESTFSGRRLEAVVAACIIWTLDQLQICHDAAEDGDHLPVLLGEWEKYSSTERVRRIATLTGVSERVIKSILTDLPGRFTIKQGERYRMNGYISTYPRYSISQSQEEEEEGEQTRPPKRRKLDDAGAAGGSTDT